MNSAESSKPRIVILGRGVAGLLAKDDTSIFALGDCASFVPEGSFVRLSHALFYRRHQLALHGQAKPHCYGPPSGSTRSRSQRLR